MRKSASRSRSRKLNSYQKAVHKYKKQIASYAAKKGIKFMAAAAKMLKQKSKSRSRKSKSRSKKSKSRSKSRSRSCGKGKTWRKAHRSVSDRRKKGKMIPGACVKKSKSRSRSRKSGRKSRSRSRK
jgi:hypothetical protein